MKKYLILLLIYFIKIERKFYNGKNQIKHNNQDLERLHGLILIINL